MVERGREKEKDEKKDKEKNNLMVIFSH